MLENKIEKNDRQSANKRVIKNFSSRFASQIVRIFISLAVMVILGRYLGESGYGEYTFWYSFIFILQTFTDIGLQVIMVREIAKCRQRVSILFGDAIILKLSISLVFFVILLIIARFGISPPHSGFLLIVGTAAIIGASQDISIWVFRGLEAMEFEALLILFSQVAWLLCLLLFIHLELGIGYLLAAQLVASAGRSLLGYVLIFRRGVVPRFKPEIKRLKLHLVSGVPVGLSFIVSVFYGYATMLLLRWLSTPADVGYLNISITLTNGFLFIAVTLTTTLFPIFSKYAHNKNDVLGVYITHASKYLSVIAIPISITLIVLSQEIISIIFKEGFTTSIITLRLISISLLAAFFNRMYRFVLPAVDAQKVYLKNELIALIINVSIGALLILKYQVIGACLSMLACEYIKFCMNYHYVRKAISPLPLIDVFLKPLCCGFVMSFFIMVGSSINIYLAVLMGTASYLTSLFIFRIFSDWEVSALKNVCSDIWAKLA